MKQIRLKDDKMIIPSCEFCPLRKEDGSCYFFTSVGNGKIPKLCELEDYDED